MPLLKYFDENGTLLYTKDERLSADNIARYAEQNGKEKAAGYIEALQDVLTELDVNIMHFQSQHQQICTSSPTKIRNGLLNFLKEQERFLASEAVRSITKEIPLF